MYSPAGGDLDDDGEEGSCGHGRGRVVEERLHARSPVRALPVTTVLHTLGEDTSHYNKDKTHTPRTCTARHHSVRHTMEDTTHTFPYVQQGDEIHPAVEERLHARSAVRALPVTTVLDTLGPHVHYPLPRC